MNKNISIIFTVAIIMVLGVVFFGGSKNNIKVGESGQNVEIKDGIQYVTINAKGGYSPKVSTAKAGISTKLIVKTDGTYDCSASLVVRSVNFKKVLAQTGEEIIDLGFPEIGQTQGSCSMGMYSFVVNFEG